ncbi:MAG: hypothetical protein EXQ94_11875 [Alphaproteobacteria bacterium]|nr:hypothetical protein [Alphaproteobacteria bacterium]
MAAVLAVTPMALFGSAGVAYADGADQGFAEGEPNGGWDGDFGDGNLSKGDDGTGDDGSIEVGNGDDGTFEGGEVKIGVDVSVGGEVETFGGTDTDTMSASGSDAASGFSAGDSGHDDGQASASAMATETLIKSGENNRKGGS